MLDLHNDFLFGVALFQTYSDADGNGLLNLTACGEHYPNRRVCRYNRADCNDPIFIIIYVEIYCVGYGNAVPFAVYVYLYFFADKGLRVFFIKRIYTTDSAGISCSVLGIVFISEIIEIVVFMVAM